MQQTGKILDRADADGATRTQPSGPGAAETEEGQLWSTFVDSGSSAEFLAAWLALQCRMFKEAKTGLLLIEQEGSFRPAAIWPTILSDVTYLGELAERTIRERTGIVHVGGRPGEGASSHSLVSYPVEVDEHLLAIIVLDVGARPGSELKGVLRQLHWGAGWLEMLFRQQRQEDMKVRLQRAFLAIDALAVVEDHETFQAAAMALVNELATRLACDRVTLGLRRGNRIRLRAMSHSAWFQKKSDLVAGIESAMQEALDQNASVVVPALPGQEQRVDVAHKALSERWGSPSSLSVVLRATGRALGVITLERAAPFDAEAVQVLELVASTTGSPLGLKADIARPIAGSLATAAGRGLRALFGPNHPALKLGAVLLVGLVATLALVDGSFRVTARSVLEGAVQRAAVAPFNGFILQAPVRAGDRVREGQVLATLDDRDLRLEVLKWQSERQKLDQRRRDAYAKHDRAGIGVIEAQIGQADAELALAQEKLARTRIFAPIDGIVVSGDLSQMLGSPIEQGKVLFEIAPLDQYRVVVQVDEGDIRYVETGQTGSLSLTGGAGQPVPLTVEKLTSVSTPQDGRNTFRVEAALAQTNLQLRPGMEGIAKIDIGAQPLLWIWTRNMIGRARLLLWTWLP